MNKIKKLFLTVVTAVILAMCGLMVACGEPKAVDQTSIKYDGQLITWSEVAKVDGYVVTINGGNEYSAPTNQFAYPVQDTEDRIEITVKAKKKNKMSEGSTKLFTRLPQIKVDDITFDENGKMTWTAVPGASEYILKINGKDTRTAGTVYTNFVQGQTNTIQIMPVAPGDSSFSSWSQQLTKEYLAPPTNIKYDGQFITFVGTTSAQNYALYINGALFDNKVHSGYTYSSDKTFTMQLQALGDGQNTFNSVLGESKKFVFLPEIKEFEVNDESALTWEAIEDAKGYTVKMDGIEYQVEEPVFDKITAGKEVTIQVKARTDEGTIFFSKYSQEKKIRLLAAPVLRWNEGIKLDDGVARNCINWNAIDGDVGGYVMEITLPNGHVQTETISNGVVEFGEAQKMNFADPGEYKLRIRTMPTAGVDTTYPSAFSTPVIVHRLPAPNEAIQNFITSDPTNLKKGVTISWQSVSGAVGYQLYKEDAVLGPRIENTIYSVPYSNFMSDDKVEGLKVNFFVQALGSYKFVPKTTGGTQLVLTLNSLMSTRLLADVEVLAQPKNLKLENYTASWDSVEKATGYGVKCVTVSKETDLDYDLKNLPDGVTEDFGVCAAGNGSNLLPSVFTPGIKLVRLAAPTEIGLDPQTDGDKLVWRGANGAERYDLCWSGQETAFVQFTSEDDINMSNYISTGSKSLFMRSVGNEWKPTENTYYVTSRPSATVTFTKLAVPTFEKTIVNGDNYLVWNAPQNLQGKDITYKIYDESGTLLSTVNKTEYDISQLDGGRYSYWVKAIGDGETYLTSEKSVTLTFTKLPKPEVKVKGNAYTWTYDEYIPEDFVVYIDGKLVKTVSYDVNTSEYSYVPDVFVEPKKEGVPVRIYARGDRMETIDSADYTKSQKTIKASSPAFKLSYVNEDGTPATHYVENGKLVVTVTTESNFTNGYRVVISNKNGASVTGYIKEANAEGKYVYDEYYVTSSDACSVQVFALGGMFDDKAEPYNYYVASDSQAAKTMTFLAAPTGVEKDGKSIVWKMPGAIPSSYTVEITCTHGDFKFENISATELKLSTINNWLTENGYEEITMANISAIKVYANGNGSTTIGSKAGVWDPV